MENSLMRKHTTPRQNHEQNYRRSRANLLFVVIATAINLLLLVTNSDLYFLFSAFIPFFITSLGMFLCGRFPAEYYEDGLSEMPFFGNSLFAVLLAISIALTLLYLLAWFMSNKNRVGWLIFALVFFSVDTLGMLLINGFAVDSIIDILFHALVIYYLIIGISAHYKLKKLPPDENEVNAENSDSVITQASNSDIMRPADTEVKHRVLLEARVLDYAICYRRVNHTNELVINGNVYDEFEGAIEPAHTLTARIDGHYIEAGFNGISSFISVDGEKAAKKLRLI